MVKDMFNKLLDVPDFYRDSYEDEIDTTTIELDPVAGDKIIATLDPDEKRKYVNLLGINQRRQELLEEAHVIVNESVARNILDTGKGVLDALDSLGDDPEVVYLLQEHYYLEAIWKKESAAFWFDLRKRCKKFGNRLEIRARYTVVELPSAPRAPHRVT